MEEPDARWLPRAQANLMELKSANETGSSWICTPLLLRWAPATCKWASSAIKGSKSQDGGGTREEGKGCLLMI